MACEHLSDPVGERCDHAAHKRGAGGHFGGGVELGIDELGHEIGGEEHVHDAPGRAELAAVHVHVADLDLAEPLAFGIRFGLGQPGDAELC
jgi:hypothetical protein